MQINPLVPSMIFMFLSASGTQIHKNLYSLQRNLRDLIAENRVFKL